MSVFTPRKTLKPVEYPAANDFRLAISHSYWLHSEWDFESDKLDFAVRLTPAQRGVIERTLLTISQIEVSVKLFWARIGERFPKPEFIALGITFAESEVRHSDAYSELLEKLGLNDAFSRLLEEPVIQGRVDYLTEFLAGSAAQDDQKYALTVAMFALFIENVSLFTQFAIAKSFNKHLNVLKDVDNVIQATMKEELVHARFGSWLLNQIRQEQPQWFENGEFESRLHRACQKAYAAECNILDWIIGQTPELHPELDFLSGPQLRAFLKQRFNESLQSVGVAPLFAVSSELLAPLRWLEEEIHAPTHTDFFHKKSVNYAKATQAYSPSSIF